jgi:acetyltransferase
MGENKGACASVPEAPMNLLSLGKIFKPQRIALAGVSPNPKSVSGRILANLVGGGFRGVVYPVSPTVEAVMGIPCFPNPASLPKIADLGIICAPAVQVPGLVRECGEAGIRGMIIVSAGFRETGADGLALERSVLAEARRFEGMRRRPQRFPPPSRLSQAHLAPLRAHGRPVLASHVRHRARLRD